MKVCSSRSLTRCNCSQNASAAWSKKRRKVWGLGSSASPSNIGKCCWNVRMTLFPSDPTPEQWGRARPISFAIWIGYIALFGIAVETGVVMVVYLRDALQQRFKVPGLIEADSDSAAIEGAVQRLRPK